eukprot:4419276-Alexandrium_andersonii.AAC.1
MSLPFPLAVRSGLSLATLPSGARETPRSRSSWSPPPLQSNRRPLAASFRTASGTSSKCSAAEPCGRARV